MKRTAVLIYQGFCNFELSVALEMLAMAGKPITVFAVDKNVVRSEEGLMVLPDESIDELDVDDYDSLLLTGAADIAEAINNPSVIDFVKAFGERHCIIGAISIAPLLLVKAGSLAGKRFMAGVNKGEAIEEGFTEAELCHMVGWDDAIQHPVADGYIRDGNVITSVAFHFIQWAMAFGRAIGIEVHPKAFGLRE